MYIQHDLPLKNIQKTYYILVMQGLSFTCHTLYEDYDEMIEDKYTVDTGFWRVKQKK